MNKLPENWFIKINVKNQLTVSKWYGRNLKTDEIAGMVLWKDGKIEKGYNPQTIIISEGQNGYDFGTEISFETFERLVLEINKEKHYELW